MINNKLRQQNENEKNMFSDEIINIPWDETTQKIMNKTSKDVERALRKNRCDVEDLMALISPAAPP